MDQRNWGGCIDVKLLPSGSAAPPPATDAPPSECKQYCSDMSLYCAGAVSQYSSTNECLRSCANFTRSAEQAAAASPVGNNFECRRAKLNLLVDSSKTTTNCPLAGPKASGVCTDAAGSAERTPSPCYSWCTALASKCASKTSINDCLQSCAGLYDTSVGSTASPPVGDNVRCRAAAALSASCSDAALVPTGICKAQNPLKALPDVLSATYSTLPSLCESPEDAAANTIAGCCCLRGNVTLIHVQGSTLATVTSALRIQGGAMCSAGEIAVAQYNFTGKQPIVNGVYVNYTFASAVAVTNVQELVVSQSKDATSSTLEGTLTLGGDPFQFQLLVGADGIPTLLLTNDVPSSTKPRVCSMQAAYGTRINSSAMTPPTPTDPATAGKGIEAAASTAKVGVAGAILLVAAILMA